MFLLGLVSLIIILSLIGLYFYLNRRKDDFNSPIIQQNSINFKNIKHIGWLQSKTPFNNLILYLDIIDKKYFTLPIDSNEKTILDNIENPINNNKVEVNGNEYIIELEEFIN